MIRYGDLDQWVVRKITESAIIGKETKTLYCVGPTDTIIGNRPFESKVSPWGSSNVMARVSGITKASVSVYPERRDEGYCARLETGIESISAMGIMNVKVLVGGCLYLGRFLEPAKKSRMVEFVWLPKISKNFKRPIGLGLLKGNSSKMSFSSIVPC